MKNTVRESIISSLRKLEDLTEKSQQIASKILKLEEELKRISKSIEKEEDRIQNLGLKQQSRDPLNPDTSEELLRKEKENEKLQVEKIEIISAFNNQKERKYQSGALSELILAAKKPSENL